MSLEEPVALPALVDHDVPARPAGAGRAAPGVQAGIATAALDLAISSENAGGPMPLTSPRASSPPGTDSTSDTIDGHVSRSLSTGFTVNTRPCGGSPKPCPSQVCRRLLTLPWRQRAPKASSSNR